MSNFDCLGMNYRQQRRYKEHIRERDNYTCQLCGSPGRDVDHIVPYSVSHDSSENNLRVLCHKCNLIDRENPRANPIKTLDAWYSYIKRELSCYV